MAAGYCWYYWHLLNLLTSSSSSPIKCRILYITLLILQVLPTTTAKRVGGLPSERGVGPLLSHACEVVRGGPDAPMNCGIQKLDDTKDIWNHCMYTSMKKYIKVSWACWWRESPTYLEPSIYYHVFIYRVKTKIHGLSTRAFLGHPEVPESPKGDKTTTNTARFGRVLIFTFRVWLFEVGKWKLT